MGRARPGVISWWAVIAPITAVACGASHQSPEVQADRQYSRSYARSGCGPTDGPAVLLFFHDSREKAVRPPEKHIVIEVWGSQDLSHQTLQVPVTRFAGSVARCTSVNSCENATRGHVAFGAAKPGKTYDGELDVTLADGERVRKTFKAPWQSRPLVIC